MSTQANPAVSKAAEGLLASFSDKFVTKAEAKTAIESAMESIKKDLLAEIVAAKKAPEVAKATKNWVVKSNITGEKRAGRIPSDAKYAAEVDYVKRAISDGTASAGGSLIPQEWADFVIPELGARTVVLKAGPNVVPMQHQVMNIPGITVNQTVGMVGENAAITESDPTTNNTPLTLHSAKALTGLSLEWLRDATPET